VVYLFPGAKSKAGKKKAAVETEAIEAVDSEPAKVANNPATKVVDPAVDPAKDPDTVAIDL
jgi:hypothetical protein